MLFILSYCKWNTKIKRFSGLERGGRPGLKFLKSDQNNFF